MVPSKHVEYSAVCFSFPFLPSVSLSVSCLLQCYIKQLLECLMYCIAYVREGHYGMVNISIVVLNIKRDSKEFEWNTLSFISVSILNLCHLAEILSMLNKQQGDIITIMQSSYSPIILPPSIQLKYRVRGKGGSKKRVYD